MKKNIYLFIYLSLFCFACADPVPENEMDEDWQPIFNGEDLSGWDIKITGFPVNENYKNTFRVEDKMLRISYDEYDEFGDAFGHLYYEQAFSHYKLKFDYRFVGEQIEGGAAWNVRNSGVMLHSQSAASNELGQHFPVSVELQLLGGLGTEERSTANVCTPGTAVMMGDTINYKHCISSDSKTYHGDQWVSVEAVVLGDSVIHHIVEGDTVLTFFNPMIGGGMIYRDSTNEQWGQFGIQAYEGWVMRDGALLNKGYIALQAESHPIDFRNIEILDLTKEEK